MEVCSEHLRLLKKCFLIECEELLKMENNGLYLLLQQLNVRGSMVVDVLKVATQIILEEERDKGFHEGCPCKKERKIMREDEIGTNNPTRSGTTYKCTLAIVDFGRPTSYNVTMGPLFHEPT